jgi:hypothetical protein
MRNAINLSSASIDEQIAALLAARGEATRNERLTYRAHTRGPLNDAFRKLLSAGLNARAAAAAIKAVEPTIAATIKPVSTLTHIPPQAAIGHSNRFPLARQEARHENYRLYADEKGKMHYRDTDKLFVTVMGAKQAKTDGKLRFDILEANPGMTVAEFKAELAKYTAKGLSGYKYSGDVNHNMKEGLLRIERD